jgi:hypothetical protein
MVTVLRNSVRQNAYSSPRMIITTVDRIQGARSILLPMLEVRMQFSACTQRQGTLTESSLFLLSVSPSESQHTILKHATAVFSHALSDSQLAPSNLNYCQSVPGCLLTPSTVSLICEEHLLSVIVMIEMAIMAAASVSVKTRSCG